MKRKKFNEIRTKNETQKRRIRLERNRKHKRTRKIGNGFSRAVQTCWCLRFSVCTCSYESMANEIWKASTILMLIGKSTWKLCATTATGYTPLILITFSIFSCLWTQGNLFVFWIEKRQYILFLIIFQFFKQLAHTLRMTEVTLQPPVRFLCWNVTKKDFMIVYFKLGCHVCELGQKVS